MFRIILTTAAFFVCSLGFAADSDNDGIDDLTEGLYNNGAAETVLNNAGFEDPASVTTLSLLDASEVPFWSTTATDNIIELWENGHESVPSYEGDQFAEINAYEAAALYQDITTVPGTTLTWTVAHRGRFGTDTATVSVGAPGATLTLVETMITDNTAWVVYSGRYNVPTGQTTTRISFEAIGGGSAGNFIDGFELTRVSIDTDGDGTADYLDLDSDNDGMSDLFESGDTAGILLDTDGDGTLTLLEATDNDNDNDGLMDVFEDGDLSSSSGTEPVDTDNDGVGDFIDLDSDNDLIPDTIEARATAAYDPHANDGTDNIDTDGDGILDMFDTNAGSPQEFGGTASSLVTPVDTDSDGVVDSRDFDSDNDTVSDKAESGLTSTGTDNNGDGIADDVNASYSDADSNIDDPASSLTNSDTDSADVDYRSLNDKDGDNVADHVDIDDDNDGIIDLNEGLGSDFNWASAITVSGNTFSGTINGIGFTYESSSPISTAATMQGHSLFPAEYNVPNIDPTVANLQVTTNTLWFDEPVLNPVFVFGSIGRENLTVPILFDVEYELLWSYNNTVTVDSPTQLSGTEGHAIIRIPGIHKSITFDYLVAEISANFVFGSEVITETFTDSDSTPDHSDLDSDNDGISDLYESGDAAGAVLDSDGNGTLTLTEAVDSDGDGLMDIFEDGNLTTDAGTTPLNSDTDAIPDYLDLDSDDDGIADTIEARPTDAYVANDGDVTDNDANGDGVIDLFDSNDGTPGDFGGTHANFNAPNNSDGSGLPDYLDSDSDDDTQLDSAESGLAAATDATYADPDGSVTTTFASLSNEADGNSEVGFRETDYDGDNIADDVDTDDDNDVYQISSKAIPIPTTMARQTI